MLLLFKIQKTDEAVKIVVMYNFWPFGLQSMPVFGIQKSHQQ